MTIKRSAVIVTEDVVVAAMLSDCWAKSGKYITVLESPRMARPDAENEVARTLNVINRVRPAVVIYFGKDQKLEQALDSKLPIPVLRVEKIGELARFGIEIDSWAGLTPKQAVQRLYDKHCTVEPNSKCIVYNGVADIGYLITANYAILHGAKLVQLDTPEELLEETIGDLNRVDASRADVRQIDVKALSEKLAGFLTEEIKKNDYERILIVTEGIPFGLAIDNPNVIYANNLMLGHFLAHNIYEFDWGKNERIGPIGLFIADRNVEMPDEYNNFSEAFARTKGLPKKLTTSHPKRTELEIMTLPYDILYIATHGKQLIGVEEEYEIVGEDKKSHSIVIDRAHGLIGFVAFVKLVDGITKDAVGWTDDHGKVWHDFCQQYMIAGKPLPVPTKTKTGITLPMRTLVLGNEPGMNSPFAVQRLASAQRPIVVANACGSWTEMSARFTFAGAAAYIGTLWAVSHRTAAIFCKNFSENLFNKDLNKVFFEARDALTDEMDKLNYVITASFENKYDADTDFSSNGYEEVKQRLTRNLAVTKERIKLFDKTTPKDIKNNTEIDEYKYESELKDLAEALESASD